MGRYGEFPSSGYYGASNSFPQNAYVEVENLENGKRTRLIIVDRLSDSGLLMLVSGDAAQDLGIYQSNIARIKVRLLSSGVAERSVGADDLAYNPDPDINPAAALVNPAEQEVEPVAAARTVSEAPAEEERPEPVRVPAVEAVPPAAAEAAETEEAPNRPLWPEDGRVSTVPAEEVSPPRLQADELASAGSPSQPASPSETAEDIPDEHINWPEGNLSSGRDKEDPLTLRSDELAEAEDPAQPALPSSSAEDIPEEHVNWPEGKLPDSSEESDPPVLTADNLEARSAAGAGEVQGDEPAVPEPVELWPDDMVRSDSPAENPAELSSDRLAESEPETQPGSDSEIALPGDSQLWPADDADDAVAEDSEPSGPESDRLGSGEPSDSAELVSDNPEDYPDTGVELVSAGLSEGRPQNDETEAVVVENYPEIVEKDVAVDEITETSAYREPEAETSPSSVVLVEPVPEIREEVVAILADDSVELGTAEPEVDSGRVDYIDSPVPQSGNDEVLSSDIASAAPISSESIDFAEAAHPELPLSDDVRPVEVADGYIAPGSEPAEPLSRSELDSPAVPEPAELAEESDQPEFAEAPVEVVEADGDPEAEPVPAERLKPEYDENLEVSLEPAEARPPEAEDLPEIVTADAESEAMPLPEPVTVVDDSPQAAEPVEPSPVPAVIDGVYEHLVFADKLESKKHYLQIGAFKERGTAINAAGDLEKSYPVTILDDAKGGSGSYKLLLGPLTADESGILLYNFRAGGYSDAFIRRVE